MKYHILRDYRTSTPFKGKSFDHFKDLHKLRLLTNFDVYLTSFLGGVIKYALKAFLSLESVGWKTGYVKWGAGDSNMRPLVYEASVLPTELSFRMKN